MRDTIQEDWERVVKVWCKWKEDSAYPDMALFALITDLRKYDKGIDYPLRRLKGHEKYSHLIRTYGAPSSKYPRYPFKWNGRIWALIRVKNPTLQSNLSPIMTNTGKEDP